MVESHRFSVHLALGGGSVADVLLWRKWCVSGGLLIGSTALWFLFERAGYNLLSFVANVLLLLVVILFFWAKSASLLNRPLPPIPDLQVSEAALVRVGDVVRVWVNYALAIAHDIAVNGNVRLLVQVCSALWLISFIGSFFNFLTLLYVVVLLSSSIPLVYDMFQDRIDGKLVVASNAIETQYKKLEETVLSKLPLPVNKTKKTQ